MVACATVLERPGIGVPRSVQAVEVTIQNLIGSGMDPKTENNPYLGFIYTSFQARMFFPHPTSSGNWQACFLVMAAGRATTTSRLS